VNANGLGCPGQLHGAQPLPTTLTFIIYI